MQENQEPYLEEDSVFRAINRYEEMLRRNRFEYFDVFEFEIIIDYFLDQHKFQQANQAIELSLRQHPAASTLRFRLGQMYIQSGKPSKGLHILKEIEHLEGSNCDYYLLLGAAYNILGNKEKAKQAFEDSIKYSYENKDEVIYNIAYSYVNTRRYNQAIHYLLLALEINPENLAVLYELAMVYERLDNWQKAVQYYTEYLEYEPFSYNVWINLGMAYIHTSKYSKAIEAFDYAIAIDPESNSAYFSKANVLIEDSKIEQAIEVYKEVIVVDPFNIQAYTYLGECYEKIGAFQRAIHYYKKAILQDASYSEAWYGIGMCLYHLKKYEESVRCFEKASSIDPENADYWFMLGEVYALVDNENKSAEAFNRTVELDPNDHEAWINRAELSFKQKDIKEAIKILSKGHKFNEDNSSINYKLATYYFHNNQPQEGCHFYERGLLINFTEHTSYYSELPEESSKNQISELLKKFQQNKSK
ncbi:MAG: tetratricopeptide repeat protein [Bacteroidales bacterium]|nr:tetratricopeptide repeat protein [Bacteroidales bacterium]